MNIIKKFKRAVSGLSELTAELSVKTEVAAGLAVLGLAGWAGVRRSEWLALVGVISAIIILEGLNTVLEKIIDLSEPRYHEAVRQIKDALAGLVLIAVAGAAVIGLVIFWPYLKPLL